jgi:hypothetical protein
MMTMKEPEMSPKSSKMLRSCVAIFLLCLVVSTGVGQVRAVSTGIDGIVAQIVKARDLTSGYVSLAATSFQKGSPELLAAQKLYIAAYSDNTAWDSYVASSLRGGRARHLNSDDQYQKNADRATVSATRFVQYVDEKTNAQSKAVLTVLSSLADLGVKLWTNISDKNKKDRESAASNFENVTKWKSWDELVLTSRSLETGKSKSDVAPPK